MCFAYLVTLKLELKYEASDISNKMQTVCLSISYNDQLKLNELSIGKETEGDIGCTMIFTF